MATQLQPVWQGLLGLSEIETSPDIVIGERTVVTRTWVGQHSLCLSAAPGRGARGTGIASGLRVTEVAIKKERGARGTLIIKYEPDQDGGAGIGGQGTLPPNEYHIDQDKFDRELQNHPRYAGLSQSLLNRVTSAIRNPLAAWAQMFADGEAELLPVEDRPNFDRALELYLKLKRGFTHYPTYPPVIRFVEYSIQFPQGVSVGGFRQDPSDFFIGVPEGVDYLRQADKVSWNGSHWRRELSWIGQADLDRDIFG